MLEHVPEWLGRALKGVRAGPEKVAVADPTLGTFAAMTLASQAFGEGGRLPERFTADVSAPASPPLHWGDPPAGTVRLALLVEDADSPTPAPLVHAVVWDLPPRAGALAEGAIAADGQAVAGQGVAGQGVAGGQGDAAGQDEADAGPDVGRNSYSREGWLPPDPPTGHGEHRYVFQLFALGAGAGDAGDNPGRSALVAAMRGHVLAAGVLTGTYSRGDPAGAGPVGATAPA